MGAIVVVDKMCRVFVIAVDAEMYRVDVHLVGVEAELWCVEVDPAMGEAT